MKFNNSPVEEVKDHTRLTQPKRAEWLQVNKSTKSLSQLLFQYPRAAGYTRNGKSGSSINQWKPLFLHHVKPTEFNFPVLLVRTQVDLARYFDKPPS